ncbi:hypothetical protein [Pyxidicoccus xibeiensis]|uniref:hypothetical protein n=1 Tax=Pyxidicoccus xibeiensis TaxID=2906759 RepID=UPI0020A744A6|nr:hypothetical protein [Pyxidicoccus xibeiensis]MCP3143155.1 hypothetical protein [Pyxidicoccus xibeiensis]
MRRQSFRAVPAWAAALVCAVSLGGCKKEPPAAPPVAEGAAVDAGQATAAAPAAKEPVKAVAETRTPFTFKDVKIAKVGGEVRLTYTLVNQGGRRARGTSCLALLDKEGYFLSHLTLGPVSLRGGESDVFEDKTSMYQDVWAQAGAVQLYVSASCHSSTSDKVVSQVSHLDPTGAPVPPGTPAPRELGSVEDGTIAFELKDASLSRGNPSEQVSLTFTVKNTSTQRLKADLCVRLYDSAASAGHLDQATSDYFNLAPGASSTLTSSLLLDDEQHWGSITVAKVYASNYGCSGSARAALSNVVEVEKPSYIESPPPEGQEHIYDEPTVLEENADLVDESGELRDEVPAAE